MIFDILELRILITSLSDVGFDMFSMSFRVQTIGSLIFLLCRLNFAMVCIGNSH